MTNLTNKTLSQVFNLAQTSGAIANIADQLLSRILLEENATAAPLPLTCPRPLIVPISITCKKCIGGFKLCQRCCRLSLQPRPICYPVRIAC